MTRPNPGNADGHDGSPLLLRIDELTLLHQPVVVLLRLVQPRVVTVLVDEAKLFRDSKKALPRLPLTPHALVDELPDVRVVVLAKDGQVLDVAHNRCVVRHTLLLLFLLLVGADLS